MLRQQGTVGGGVLLGLLVLAAASRTFSTVDPTSGPQSAWTTGTPPENDTAGGLGTIQPP